MRNRRLYAVHTDHLGTPRLVTDDERRPVWQWPYSAFGNNRPTGPLVRRAPANQPPHLRRTEPIEFGLRFPGQHEDAEAGLSNNLFRWYHAANGRYTQADRIGLRGGLNRFGYVEGDPINFFDPAGLSKFGARRGERGLTGSPNGTSNPYKHMKPHPADPNKVLFTDPHTGKKIEKPKPPGYDQQKGSVDLDLLEGFLPWWLTPSPLACATLDCHPEILQKIESRTCRKE